VLDTIISIAPKESSGGGGISREALVGAQAEDMLKKLPPDYDPFEVKARSLSLKPRHQAHQSLCPINLGKYFQVEDYGNPKFNEHISEAGN
jgi:hypothetical protein